MDADLFCMYVSFHNFAFILRIMKNQSIAALRKDYRNAELHETDMASDPVQQFDIWFQQAMVAQVPEPNAMTLATADASGRPSARMVLLKGLDSSGFTFFTNYNSHKASDLTENPQAALVFYWHELERQVRVEGKVKRLKSKDSDEYYNSRPLDSRLGAWASPQSQTIAGRDILEQQFDNLKLLYANQSPPRPDFWGGYCIVPDTIEFWQGRTSRMHDRIQYKKNSRGVWKISRLAP
jgi:pyridoxamine 5'-phosphate oxidase